jgi:hypothetical protein
MTESEDTRECGENNMLEYILSPTNLNAAYKQVLRNKGVGGIDKMEVMELKDYLTAHKRALSQSNSCKLKNRRVPNGTHGGVRGRNGK